MSRPKMIVLLPSSDDEGPARVSIPTPVLICQALIDQHYAIGEDPIGHACSNPGAMRLSHADSAFLLCAPCATCLCYGMWVSAHARSISLRTGDGRFFSFFPRGAEIPCTCGDNEAVRRPDSPPCPLHPMTGAN